MLSFKVEIKALPLEISNGLQEIRKEYSDRFNADGIALRFVSDRTQGAGNSVVFDDNVVTVRFARPCDAFRAMGRLLGMTDEQAVRQGFSENSRFDMIGIMLDVSRNGVMTPEAVEAYILRCALMGINTLMLYCEDTYEVPAEPLFGYLRGAYSAAELKRIDDYAFNLGIEVVPCIQTLGHMAAVLQWPAYAEYCDTENVILTGWEKSYELLEKMLKAASSPLRSSRIHIGMDETFGLGTGRFKQLFGDKPCLDIFNDHLKRVLDICRRLDLSPMIWSDMYFRTGSKTDDYYDRETVMPRELAAAIPAEVEMVYWDYYHGDRDFYEEFIDKHRAIGFEPVMAGGVWTWNHFWAALPFSLKATEACMQACKAKGLRQAFVTMWGDDGMECDIYSALPGVQFFAEHCYAGEVDQALLRSNFRGSCGADFDDWVKAGELDRVPGITDPDDTYLADNISKWLLWQDPLLSLMDPHIEHLELREYYDGLADYLFGASVKGPSALRLRFPAHLSRVLALKSGLRRKLAAAYAAGDKVRLRQIAGSDLASLRAAVDELWKCHREMWLSTYKPFGLEVLERRYGGLRTRLESLSDRLSGYLNGDLEAIPELEVKLEKVFTQEGCALPYAGYARVATPSHIK
ncbi:MAG: beta-N-acetylhexosaminidase [bacterium]|nr:beta-N-acetylhexosaminidase [bacterium]